MTYKIAPILFLFGLFSFTTNPIIFHKAVVSKLETANFNTFPEDKINTIYNNLDANNFTLPKAEIFAKAFKGFYQFKEKGFLQKDILTLVDFSLSSQKKRLWVIDLKSNIILFQSLVAHGRNSGNEYATKFSNKPESNKSSLGFYSTGETYYGKNGYSLRLDGLQKGINNNVRERAIVIHGADYVSENFIKQNGSLGRSLGCPSLPMKTSKIIIDAIKNKSCLFVYHP